MDNYKKCKIIECNNNAHYTMKAGLGYCIKHYQQIKKYGKIMDEQRAEEREKRKNEKCKVGECNKSAYWKNKGTSGYCNKHYQQIKKYGKILTRTRLDPNEIIDCGDYYEIVLYKGKKMPLEIGRTLIDKDDLDKVRNYKWSISIKNKNKYVYNIKNKIPLHHLIMEKPPYGYEIDHKDTNPLNNRKSNLRIVTKQQNGMNRGLNRNNISGFTGVFREKRRNKWIANIVINNKYIYLGGFIDIKDAINARRQAEQKYFGEFAYKYN